MSEITNIEQTRNQLITNYDVSKFLLGYNSFGHGDIEADGADISLLQGMVMGRISATGKIVPLVPTATDGSQLPVGLCIVDQTITDGTTVNLSLVNKGRVAEGKINFSAAGDLDTAVGPANNQKILRDCLEDLGLILEEAEELTGFDNQ
jgi:hypothetical protein